MTSIDFQIKQRQEQEVRGGSAHFKHRRSLLQREGDNAEAHDRRTTINTAMTTKTQEELEL